MSSSYDTDDLDPEPRKATNAKEVQSSPSISSSDAADLDPYGDNDRPRKKQKAPLGASRVVWTDSDGEDAGAAAYKKFKTKGSVARKQALKSTKKAKAAEAERNPSKKIRDQGTTGVGRQAPKRKKQNPHSAHDDGIPSEEEGMGHTMPEYVQERRNRFNERHHKMREAGLALPPTYDDIYFSDNERIRTLRERPDLPAITPPAPYKDIELPYSLGLIPAPIAQYLREYQVKGAAFLHELFVYQKGGILGDDMGLGKTIQVIAFLTAMYGKTGDERDKKRMRKMRRKQLPYYKTLIICPGSLMANWQDELKTWGWWHADLFHGDKKDDVLAQAQSGMLEIMITTYTSYRVNKDRINTIAWDCVIADECHTIKERRSEITKSMNEINSLCRIGLTGTAIQNKFEEFWTLLNWSNPGRFGPPADWKYMISDPLKLGQSHNATTYELARARKTAKDLVHNLLPQFFLRRMKSLIKDQLPKKSDRVVFCPLTNVQREVYQNFIDSDYVQTIKQSGEMCECGSGKKAGWCCYVTLENGDPWRAWVLPCMVYLKHLCNHVALVIPSSSDAKDKQSKNTEVLKTIMPGQWQELVQTKDSMINFANPEFCGKWRVLRKLLKFWNDQGGNKVLVFSHKVRLLRMLQALFLHTKYTVEYLDGSMSYEDRFAAVQNFNSDPAQFVFLISTKAGGVGLNITSANKVVVVDPDWNPSYDLQAQDRAYRIGQTRDVEVFRLVSQGTLEEIVYARQIYKQQMSNIGLSATDERRYFTGVQDRKGMKGEIFGLDNIFAYHDENVVLRDIVHKTNVAEAKADLKIAEMDDERAEDENGSEEDNVDVPNDQTDKEDAALSQLAEEIIGDTRKKRKSPGMSSDRTTAKRHDPVQAILASAGVSYTHENSEVVGASRVETALSKRAAEASGTQREARVFLNDSQSQNRDQLGAHLADDGSLKYRYRPSESVRRRQFGAMSKWAGHEDVVEFALLVESWTQAERRDFLDKWYWHRREFMISGIQEYVGVGMESATFKRERDSGEVEVNLTRNIKVEDGVGSTFGDGDVKVEVISSDDDEL